LEKINSYTQNLKGFTVPKIEILLALKLYAYHERKNSIKGEKDKIDIISLLNTVDIDWILFKSISSRKIINEIKEIITNQDKVDELSINNQQMAKLRKNILQII